MFRTTLAGLRRRLTVEGLEDRTVPANNLNLVGAPTSDHVLISTAAGVTTIATTGPDATLSVSDLETELRRAGVNRVVVSTDVAVGGLDGLQPGDITWDAGSAPSADFTGVTFVNRLTFRTAAGTGAAGDITLTGVRFAGDSAKPAAVTVEFDTAGPGGDVTFAAGPAGGVSFDPTAVAALSVQTGTGDFDYQAGGGLPDTARVSGRVDIAAGGTLTLGNDGGLDAGTAIFVLGGEVRLATSIHAGMSVLVRGHTVVTGPTDITVTPHGPISFEGTVNGASDLTLSGTRIEFHDKVGLTTPLGTLTVRDGIVEDDRTGPLEIHAGTLALGDGVAGEFAATLTSAGQINADLVVMGDGRVAPGKLNLVGTLTVTGDVTFAGGALVLDFGGTADDLLDITGNVDVQSGDLGGKAGRGLLSGTASRPVIKYTGTLTGQFDNAPLNTPVLVAADAVRVTNYGPAGTGVTVAPLAALAEPTFVGTDVDGTEYTVRLTGGGRLVTGIDSALQRFFVARFAGPGTRLTITTAAKNGSDDEVTIGGGIVVGQWLKVFTAPNVSVGNRFRVIDATGTVTLADLLPGSLMDLGGGGGISTIVHARDLSGTVRAAYLVLTARHLAGSLTAEEIRSAILDSATEIAVTSRTGVRSFVTRGEFRGSIRANHIDVFRAGLVTGGSTLAATAVTGGTVGLVSVAGDFIGTVTANEIKTFLAGSLTGDLVSETRTASPGRIRNAVIRGSAAGNMTGVFIDRVRIGGGALSVRTALGTIGSVRVTGDGALELKAGSIRSVSVAGRLSGLGKWDAIGGIHTLTAGAIDGLDVTTSYLETLSVLGNRARSLAGDVTGSTFHLTGVNTVLRMTMRSLIATGAVRDTTFNTYGGNVGSVRFGRFLDSNFYVAYQPVGSFSTGGVFARVPWKLNRFVTTAVPTSDPASLAFAGSQVASYLLGVVRLSGLKTANGGTPFGIRFGAGVASVRVAAADDPAVPTKVNLTPSATAIAGDFFFLEV